MTDYRLEALGPQTFEQLAISLASAVFGVDFEAYGTGPDHGREATWEGRFEGDLEWPGASTRVWDGYTVVQAKHKELDQMPDRNLSWLKGQIADECKAWMTRASRGNVPRHLVFVTNARLSADAGVDAIKEFIKTQLDKPWGYPRATSLRQRGMQDCIVWHRTVVNTLIDNYASIRTAYPALLTAGDILAKVKALPGDVSPKDLTPALIDHAQSGLLNERWVRFSEASATTSKQSIERVIIDLPTVDSTGACGRAVLDCLSQGEHNLRRSQWRAKTPRHIVLTGAPGNGKSTITSFITQVYRSLFTEDDDIGQEAQRLIESTKSALQQIAVPLPRCLRWPMKIDLADMATKMNGALKPNVIRYLCDRISERCEINLLPVALHRWLKVWPSLIVFDGLDEVTSRDLRVRVLEEIDEFIERSDQEDWDLFIIITTRPTGYTERYRPVDFDQIDLAYLDQKTALRYAERVTRIRLADDQQHADEVLSSFHKAAKDETIARLILTPLQILMLTFIIEQGTSLASNRYELFWGYYEAVFRRESNKNTSLRGFFQRYEEVITDLHTRAGLLLHIRCEVEGEARPRLPRTELQEIARQRLVDIGLQGDNNINTAVTQLLDIAHTRLVLLVADQDETVSFEVRSLQEVMAARALTDAKDENILTNLRVTAPSPHWRNVWLLAAGRLLGGGDYKRDLLVGLLETIDADPKTAGWLHPIGPTLAAEVILDGSAASKPRWLRRLVEITLRVIDGPMPDDPRHIGEALSAASQQDSAAKNQIKQRFTAAFREGGSAAFIASVIASYGLMPRFPEQPVNTERIRNAWFHDSKLHTTVSVYTLIKPILAKVEDIESDLVREALQECTHLHLTHTYDGWTVPSAPWSSQTPAPSLRAAVENSEAAQVLRLCLGKLNSGDWPARSLIAHAYYLESFRNPIADQLDLPYLLVSS